MLNPLNVDLTVHSAAVENGETDASAVETWEQKGEPDEEEPGGGSPADTGCCGDEAQDEMMEEDEEMPTPKLPPPLPDAPKKEHVNVVFIGHVGMLNVLRVLEYPDKFLCYIDVLLIEYLTILSFPGSTMCGYVFVLFSKKLMTFIPNHKCYNLYKNTQKDNTNILSSEIYK